MEKGKKILLVDEVDLFLQQGKTFLNREQMEITVARSGREALHVLPALRPDLVIMNSRLPEMDGVEACRRIKTDPEFFRLPVILIAADLAGEEERCQQTGCEAILCRPLERRELLLVTRRFLELAERAAPRVETRMLVHYGVGEQLTEHDFSVNLAPGGVFLETDHLLAPDTPLTLEFFLPGGGEPLRCRGQVVWANERRGKAKPDLPTGFGVRFENLGRSVERAIKAFVHDCCRPRS